LQIDLFTVTLSLLAGLVATGIMTLLEIPSWKRWGLSGILEWHENQILSVKFFGLSPSNIHFNGIFLLHFLNGSIGGFGILLGIGLFPFLMKIHPLVIGPLYGLLLWVLTLLTIHKQLTGINPFKHPLGYGPLIVSFAGHIIYGISLVWIILNL
jgi:hypothetical protein